MTPPPPGGARILVTGATGFLGGRLAAELQREGYEVRALARTTSDTRFLDRLKIPIVRGDVTDPPSLLQAAEGCPIVVHSAGKVTDWGPREEFFRVNETGTANVIAACRQAGVRRLVHMSSLTVLGLPRTGVTVDEETPPAAPPDPYTASKLAGEILVREAHGQGGLETVVIRCGVIWGPGEPLILPRILGLMRRGKMVYIDGGRNLVGMSHVANLVAGLVLAAGTPAAAGRVYHVTDGEEITARLLLDTIAEAFNIPRPRRSVPFGLVFALASAMEAGWKLAGSASPPPLTRYGARLVACHCRYDIGRARRELGYQPVISFREGIAGLPAGYARG